VEIRDYLVIIWKRKFVIATCVLVFLIVSIVFSFLYLKPVYQATSKILVDQPDQIIMMTDGRGPMSAPLSVETQKKLMKSQSVIIRAGEKLGWDEKKSLSTLGGVLITSDEDTGIISVVVRSGNAQYCAEVANAYAYAFEEISKELADQTFKETIDYIKQQLKNAEMSLAEKEQAIFQFNLEQGVIMLDEEMKSRNELIMLSESDKISAELEIKQMETQINSLQNLFRDKQLTIVQNTDVLMDSRLITDFRLQLSELEGQRAGLLIKYKPNHPVVKELDSRINRLENKLEKYANDVVNGKYVSPSDLTAEKTFLVEMQTKLLMLRTKLANLNAIIDRLKREQMQYPKMQYEYSRLLREKEVAEKLFFLLYEQQQQAEIEQIQLDVNVRVYDKAQVPSRHISPNREKNLIIAIILGLVIGIGLSFLLEEIEETIRTSDDVKNYLNLPVLGSVPYSAETINKLITDVPLKSPIAEAYRRLSFFTQLFCLDPPIKTLLVTSSKSDEGKSTTLANLAISMAQEGTKVLVVDTDLRRPMLHRMFGVDNSLGISSILTGELEAEIAVSDLTVSGHLPKESFMDVVVDRLIQPVGVKGLSIIPSGPLPANSIELLRSERMLSFLRCIEKKADIVMFDSPPSIHVIDSVVLSQVLDGVLFVINSGRINRDEALQVKYMIESTKTPIIGVALNNIEVSSPDYYYYYYYGGYGYGSRQRRKRVKLKR